MRPSDSPGRGFALTVAPLWLRVAGLVGFALILSVFASWPMLAAYPHTQVYDGAFIHEMMESARVAVARWHELPLWNPYQCGGVPLWDNPQGMGAAPLYWPLLAIFDTTRAIEIWYVLHSAGGFLSMYVLARHEVRLSRPAALLSSAMWAFCNAHNQHITGGGFNWVPFLFLPLSLFLWRRAERDLRMAVGLGIVTSLEIWGGAAYPVSFSALILAGETLTRVWPAARLKAILRAAGVVVLVTLCLSAGRLFPVVYQMTAYKRDLGVETDALQWSTLADMFLARTHSRGVAGQTYVWPEFCDYIGPFLLGLAILGLFVGGTESAWLGGLLLFSFLLMLGHKWPTAPWNILNRHIFPYRSMRVPSRFVAAVTVFLAAYAGLAVDRAPRIARRIFGSSRAASTMGTILLVLGFVGVGDMIAVGLEWTPHAFAGAPQNLAIPVAPSFYVDGPGLADFLDQPQQNRGRTQCWEEWAPNLGAPIWTGNVPQARVADGATATVSNVTRTQNSFTLDVDASAPARVLINSNFDPGWRPSVGVAANQDKLLVVDVPAGQHHLHVKYWPRGLTFGLALTALAVVGIAAFFLLDARRRRRAVAFSAS